MRVLLALALCALILGGVWRYTATLGAPGDARAAIPATTGAANTVSGLTVELHATAPLATSPFGPTPNGPAASLLLQGAVLAAADSQPAFVTRRFDLPPLPRQRTELLARASFASEAQGHRHALQVRLLLHGTPLAEATAWSEAGLPLTVVLPVDLRHVP
ncbi:MAG: hypothetical protein LDL30_10630 [Desulfovibrio sp.]|nr:hypothetical protein [Desulfovibrio sp.]MCA1986428.1 hypothetical protein [Desulfovibrio sp.]